MNFLIEPKYEHDPMKYFQILTTIPRGSGNEKAVSDYVIEFAKQHGLWCKQDGNYNVYIKKDGSGTGKNKPAVLFQGHLDMVCEKNNDTEFDFETQAINLCIEDGWLKADGTTLGADNGVAVAYMMSLLAEDLENCPPIECLFTTEEETGMDGASAVDGSVFEAKQMINLDCGPEGVFIISCAGGRRTNLSKTLKTEPTSLNLVEIKLGGLKGGHSGSDIHLEKGNSNKLMARLLYAVSKDQPICISSINGGDKDNAIPRECTAIIAAENVDSVTKISNEMLDIFKAELESSDPGLTLNIQPADAKNNNVLSQKDSQNLINMLYLVPCGPFHRNLELNLVVNSNNLAVVSVNDGKVEINMSTRSSISSLKDDISNQFDLISQAFDYDVEHTSNYPGWAYAKDSAIRDFCKSVYEEMYGKSPEIIAIHAGLECGLLKEKMPDLDVIAMGPTTKDIHTPGEKLLIESFNNIYEYLKNVLGKIAK